MPNTKVHFSAAFVGGAAGGNGLAIFNLLSLHLGSSAVNASKIYGSLALVPLFMVGLYVVWVIVLFGAQVAYAFQNRESYLQEQLAENVNQRGREFVALRLMTCIGQRFQRGLPPATVPGNVPRTGHSQPSSSSRSCRRLLAARLVVEVPAWKPATRPRARSTRSTATTFCWRCARRRARNWSRAKNRCARKSSASSPASRRLRKAAAATVTMLALVNRAQARLELAAPTEPATEINTATPVVELTELPQRTRERDLARVDRRSSWKPNPQAFPSPRPTRAPAANGGSLNPDDNQSFPL